MIAVNSQKSKIQEAAYILGNPLGITEIPQLPHPSRNAAIIRPFQGPLHRYMVELPSKFHEFYAHVYDMDLFHIEDLCPVAADFGWFRWIYLQKFLESYEYVFYIEPDAYVTSHLIDLRLAVSQKPLAMRYGSSGGIEPPHFQCGVIYTKRSVELNNFIDDVLATIPPKNTPEESSVAWWGRKYCQQTIVNQLLQKSEEWIGVLPTLKGGKYLGFAEKLGPEWNATSYDCAKAIVPIVRAFHGAINEKEKAKLIKNELQKTRQEFTSPD